MINHKSLLLLLLLSCISQACICQTRERIFPRNLMTFEGKDFSTSAKFSWKWIHQENGEIYRVLTVEEGRADIPADKDLTAKINMRIKPEPYLAVANGKAFNGSLFATEPYISHNADGTTTTYNVVTLRSYEKIEDLYNYFESFDVLPINYKIVFTPYDLVGTNNFITGLTNKTIFYKRRLRLNQSHNRSTVITLEEYDNIKESQFD